MQFCCIERVVPADKLAAVRESVLDGREQLRHVREAESAARAELELPGRFGEITDGGPASASGEPDRLPMPPVELNDIAKQEMFAEYLVEPRLLRVAKTVLDTHLRIAQTEVNKSRAPMKGGAQNAPGVSLASSESSGATRAFTLEQLQRRGWHSDWPHDLTAYSPTSQRPWMHCGAIAQPFPDVCMALSTVRPPPTDRQLSFSQL